MVVKTVWDISEDNYHLLMAVLGPILDRKEYFFNENQHPEKLFR